MKLNEFENFLEQIIQSSGIEKEKLLEKASDFLKRNYTSESAIARREAIDKIERKILTRLYKMANHSLVAKKPEMKKIFGLDDYEANFLETALNLLEACGLIEGDRNYTRLTEKGVLIARDL